MIMTETKEKSEGLPKRSKLQEARGKSEGHDYLALFFLFVALIANILVLVMLLDPSF